ncbi:homoserine kinase [Gloeocapsopsis dulcis]|uniref:Homoserine kinase n=1 Tax=Gloeocapsopsis dulcis AAB1 = 1H9 TaxID=1433147 RepID=A0A6N8FYK6_9CHRO|nr:homoserine kinase [Gloeocapsopsis dulcis]MUL37844.1 homoserine kinase [Gloeocapsopsis dulcis AAB1 = 1H9]WNN89806.1 homoserine kinase [Gloeocapsopsis dulcis]
MTNSVSVSVPATTANLGPGFDCIGAALTLYNRFKFTHQEEVEIRVTGIESDRVRTDDSNLAYRSFVKLYETLGQIPPPVHIDIELGVPLARGLGSSATAIVGGLVGANLLAGEPLDITAVMELAIALEGHPDNVVPALLGGCRLAASVETLSRQRWEICDVPWHESVVPVVAIPDFELSTVEARRVLPSEVSRADAIFNTAHLGLLLRGLETGNEAWLGAALQDRLHQPYRQALIRGYEAVQQAAVDTGAYGLVISGAGPTLLALTNRGQAGAVIVAIAQAWQQAGVKAQVRSLEIDNQGARSSNEVA